MEWITNKSSCSFYIDIYYIFLCDIKSDLKKILNNFFSQKI